MGIYLGFCPHVRWGLDVSVTVIVTFPPSWQTGSFLLPAREDRKINGLSQISRICYARLCVMLRLMRIVLCRVTGVMNEEVEYMIERLESRCY